MSANGRIITAIDPGSYKVKAVIAEITDEDKPNILGFGTAISRGIKKGKITDLSKATESIVSAIEEAEEMAKVTPETCIATITGDHIKGINTTSAIIITDQNSDTNDLRNVEKEDLIKLTEYAKAINLPIDWKILHFLPQEYVLDDQGGIKNPLDLSCRRLEAKVHLIAYNYTNATNIKKSIENSGLKLETFVSHSIASAYGSLYRDEMELGTILIDIGGGTTDLSLHYAGGVYQTSVITVAGNNITTDIAYLLQTPLEKAEKIKKEHGLAIPSDSDADKNIDFNLINGNPSSLSKQQLAQYIEPRVEEILLEVKNECRKSNLNFLRTFPVVITGGSANLKRIDELAESIFETSSRIGIPHDFTGYEEELKKPEFSAVIGSLKYYIIASKQPDSFRTTQKRKFKWLDNFLKKFL
ncbi:MAG: cell division protein FtsA [Candidatus Marinimicrobia bacterium]|nr:cell division protein FtsA [Candidatus Neomarinimicrobiota bacterium]